MNDTAGLRKVLNVGSGPAENGRLHKAFMNDNWKELRFDIDERVKPDFVGSIQNMRGLVKDAMFDAVWSSHNLEHLHTHEVVPALREFRRILKPDGFAFVTCPDLAAITALIAEKGVRTTAYISPAGPITPSDMLYGHARSIAAGNTFMCHNTGFDAAALAADALDAGFKEARIANGAAFDLWAILTMPDTDLDLVKGVARWNTRSLSHLTMRLASTSQVPVGDRTATTGTRSRHLDPCFCEDASLMCAAHEHPICPQQLPGAIQACRAALAADPKNKVVAIGSPTAQAMPDIRLLQYRLPLQNVIQTHPFARRFDLECRRAEQVLYAATELAASGFVPDVIMVHNGWGENLPLRAVFPKARQIVYCEFYYRRDGQDVNFDPEFPVLSLDGVATLAAKNANILLSLADADLGIAPTLWQRSTFPSEFQGKIEVIHEGIDTDLVRPDANAFLQLDTGEILRKGDEIVTFVCRNLEPLRGYHVFLRALPKIQQLCPRARILIIGGDQVSYGPAPPEGTSWKKVYLEEVKVQLDMSRVYFLGHLPYTSFLKILQVSAAHVYLTYPFVLSWSMLEAMSAGCHIIAADVAPVREFIDERCGILVPFQNSSLLADAVVDVLKTPARYRDMAEAARSRIVAGYDAKRECLPKLLDCIREI